MVSTFAQDECEAETEQVVGSSADYRGIVRCPLPRCHRRPSGFVDSSDRDSRADDDCRWSLVFGALILLWSLQRARAR